MFDTDGIPDFFLITLILKRLLSSADKLCKLFRSRSGLTLFLENVDFEKIEQMTRNKNMQIYAV